MYIKKQYIPPQPELLLLFASIYMLHTLNNTTTDSLTLTLNSSLTVQYCA